VEGGVTGSEVVIILPPAREARAPSKTREVADVLHRSKDSGNSEVDPKSVTLFRP
jgi:hypothetical protein